jgi:hypothetical protein
MFHPGFAISRAVIGMALIGMALVSGVSATSAQGASGTETPTACQVRLASGRAVFKPLGELTGGPGSPAACGGPDVVLLQRIILPDHTTVAVEPPATLRCEMAEAVTDFVRDDLAPAAAAIGAPLSAIDNDDSFDCRGRNRVAGARLSEHGRANALDIRAVRLRDGRVVRLTDAAAPQGTLQAMKAAACGRFTTVLGPGSDGYHEDHIHLDRIERRSGYRICQWNVPDEPRFALQSAANQPAASPAPAVSAAVREHVPLPRPRPFKAIDAPAIILSAESRHR